MIIIINNNYAHRLLRSGLVESSNVEVVDNVGIIIDQDWQIRNAYDMNLTDGEYSVIIDALNSANCLLPIKETPLPPKEELKIEEQFVDMDKPV